MTLFEAKPGVPVYICSVETGDYATDDFLCSLGCYAGERVTVVSRFSGTVIVLVRNARYSIDEDLARCIEANSEPPRALWVG